jgi:transposase
MRFVPLKEVDQQDLQALHRARERVVKARTALVNEIRGLLAEYGIVLPQSVTKFRSGFLATLEAERAKLTALSQELFGQLYEEFGALEKRLAYYTEKLEAISAAHPVCQRLETIPGIGPLTATALVAAVSETSAFKNGRQFAAWLGLVPRQHSTGGKARLLGISKRGDVYLRKLLIHGARATLRWVGLKADRRSQWLRGLLERRGKNKTAVALANKNARIAWVLLTTDQVYTMEAVAA